MLRTDSTNFYPPAGGLLRRREGGPIPHRGDISTIGLKRRLQRDGHPISRDQPQEIAHDQSEARIGPFEVGWLLPFASGFSVGPGEFPSHATT